MRLAEPGRCRKAGPGPDNIWFTDDDTQSSYGASGIIYCGYRYDAETDNYYVRNRYYSPTLGRWLTRDPIGYQGGINLYGYAAGSPVGNVDAEGTTCWSCWGLGPEWLALGAGLFGLDVCPFGESPATGAACIAAVLTVIGSIGALLVTIGQCIGCLEKHPCKNRAKIKKLEKEVRRLERKMKSLKRRLP